MSYRNRIADLERRSAEAPRACPGCGAVNRCGVALAVYGDGRAVPRCLNCGAERESPEGPVKAYAADLWDTEGGLCI